MYTIPLRLRSLFRWARADQELDEELRDHLERKTEEYVAQGMTQEEAHRRAHLELGGVEKVKEECRDTRGIAWIESVVQDLRFGARMLRKSTGFTSAAVLTLSLGIGANAAIFSLVDCLVLRPLPIKQAARVGFLVSESKTGHSSTTFSYPDFKDIRNQTTDVFSDVAAIQAFQMDGLTVDGNSESMWGSYVSGNFFELMGIHSVLGRLILPSEGQVEGADPVLVLSYSYWKSRFNADRQIVGKKASVNGQPVTIVGVAPEGFHGLTALLDTQGYLPLGMAAVLRDSPKGFLAAREDKNFVLVARLSPTATNQQRQVALNIVAQRLSQQYPKADEWATLRAFHLGPAGLAINPTNPDALSFVSVPFLILGVFLLALVCVNLTSLLLVRAGIRQREMAVRAALGGKRGRLVRQLLIESLLLSLFGCVAGIILGLGASRIFGSISLHTSLPVVLDFHFDWRVFTYAFAAALLAGLLVGIVPAFRGASVNLNKVLHDSGRTATPGRQRVRQTLVVAQVCGSLMLLVVAGLFVRSLENVQNSDLGFDPRNVLNLTIDPHEAGYEEAQAQQFFRNLLDRARTVPGVQSASISASVPMGYYNLAAGLKIDGYQPPQGQASPYASFNAISPGYFQTMRIPLIRGRDFLDSDDQNSQRVAIINQSMADRYWHGQNPLGRHFNIASDPNHSLEIVGVVQNSRQEAYSTEFYSFFYLPEAQHYEPFGTLQVRTALPPEAIAHEMIGLVHSLESAMPILDVQPMTAALETANGFLIFQFAAALAASLGALGLLLAIVGVYGVISYAASHRAHEIGVRMALGAQPRQVLWIILRQGFGIVALGVLIGVFAAAAIAKMVGNLLINVSPTDPQTYVAASLLLALIALAACYIPALRAVRGDPMTALRYE